MRAVALVPFAALALLFIAVPVASVAILPLPTLGAALADPALRIAALRSLSTGATELAVGWPAGVVAAFAIWDAGNWLRRGVLGTGVVLAVLPVAGVTGLGRLAGNPALLAAHAAPSAGLALLILTTGLDRLDPGILRSAASCGATPWQSWRLVLWPALGWTPWVAAAGGFALSVLAASGRGPQ